MEQPFGISTYFLLKEAKKRGIKIEVIYPGWIAKLTYGSHEECFIEQLFSGTTSVGFQACNEKDYTKVFISRKGISVAPGKAFSRDDLEDALKYVKTDIGWPSVIKPTNAMHGWDVYANITSEEEFIKCYKKVGQRFENILVEKRFEGEDFRILTTKEKVVGIIKRIPANVVGDGKSTIRQLVEEKNKDPRRGDDDSYLNPDQIYVKIKLDDVAEDMVKRQGYTFDSVPKEKEMVYLRSNANISSGGDSIDLTDEAHESVKEIAVKTIQAIPGLAYGGVDIMTKDITKPQTSDSYIIVEVNARPGIGIHIDPLIGKPRNAAKDIIDLAFPETINIQESLIESRDIVADKTGAL